MKNVQMNNYFVNNTCSVMLSSYTPLMEAAREGHLEMVALLLEHGKKYIVI